MTAAKPLAGVRVLELARILAGPWAGQMLADLGADVVKVERPGAGDDTRGWGPPFVEGADGGTSRRPISMPATAASARSPSTSKRPKARRSCARLAARRRRGDRELQGRRAREIRARLRRACAAVNPRLVYCSITGFGQDGPYAPRAGYDFIIQAMGGIMDLTGEPDGEPQKPGVAFADIFTGLYAVVGDPGGACAGATRTGRGQRISTWRSFDAQVARARQPGD